MHDTIKLLVRCFTIVALCCAAMYATHGRALAVTNCSANKEISGATTGSIALGTTFDPTALVAGSQIQGSIQGSCKNLTGSAPGTVVLTFNAGGSYSSGFALRGMLCSTCAGPSPFNTLYYKLFQSDGVTPITNGQNITITCSTGNCTSGTSGTFTYTFYGQIAQPVAASSLNDAQLGSYSDASMSVSVTGSGDTSPGTAAFTVTGSVIQACTVSWVGDVSFGSYDPVTVAAVTDAAGSVLVTCTRSSAGVTLTLSAGNNSANATTPSTRAMKGLSSANYLSYDIFEDSGHATRFPITAIAETIAGGITSPSTIGLFGEIPATPQDVNIDTYKDQVTATVNF